MSRLLIVTAVDAERDAVGRLLNPRGDMLGWHPVSVATTAMGEVVIMAGGAGPAASAASAAAALATADAAGNPFDLALSMGIGGGFGLPPGTVVCASQIVFADLGSELGEPLGRQGADAVAQFASAEELDYGRNSYAVTREVSAEVTRRTGALVGPVLTVATVTGTASTAAAHRARYPNALAEGMEGAGLAAAAAELAVAYGEVRVISNEVGPRDRLNWRIPQALHALAAAALALTS